MGLLDKLTSNGSQLTPYDGDNPDKYNQQSKYLDGLAKSQLDLDGRKPLEYDKQTVQILYYAQPTFISSTTSSNLYLAYYPDALLYATLAEAEPYLMNDQRIATWSALYDRAIANIKKSDLGSTYPYTT